MDERLLKKHIMLTPRMEPVDAVKLAFQGAFGCGHLLSGRRDCAAYVARELAETTTDEGAPAYTPIGGGMSRLNLRSPAVRRLSPERIADLMILTASQIGLGDRDGFERDLTLLETMTRKGQTPFSQQALADYRTAYRAQGCPPVSHSPAYRAAYGPAYRVVLTPLAQAVELLAAADDRLRRDGQVTLVLDGPCAAGKTTLAALLARLYQTKPISMDDFFLPVELRTPQRLAQPGGNVHYERFADEVLAGLLTGRPFDYRRFDCHTGDILQRHYQPASVTLIEGSYSHHPAFEQAYRQLRPLKVWLDVSEAEQLRRLEKRNPQMLQMFINRWMPLEKSYREAYHIPKDADMILRMEEWL